ncbi:MAG: hypothetical protein WCI18_05770 [Pseudomonadota bacterium]
MKAAFFAQPIEGSVAMSGIIVNSFSVEFDVIRIHFNRSSSVCLNWQSYKKNRIAETAEPWATGCGLLSFV